MMSEYQRGYHEAMHCLCFSDHVTTRMVTGAGYLYSAPSTPQPSRRDALSRPQPKVPQCETSPQMQGKRRTQRMSIRQKERPQGAAKGPDPSHGSSAVSNKKNKHSASFKAFRNAASRLQARQGEARTSRLQSYHTNIPPSRVRGTKYGHHREREEPELAEPRVTDSPYARKSQASETMRLASVISFPRMMYKRSCNMTSPHQG